MARIRWSAVRGTLTADLSDSGTTMEADELAELPEVSAPDVAAIILDPTGLTGKPEIVWITDHATDATTATITRGQETATGGAAARAHVTGVLWRHGPTPADFGESGSYPTGTTVFNKSSDPTPDTYLDDLSGVTTPSATFIVKAGSTVNPSALPPSSALDHFTIIVSRVEGSGDVTLDLQDIVYTPADVPVLVTGEYGYVAAVLEPIGGPGVSPSEWAIGGLFPGDFATEAYVDDAVAAEATARGAAISAAISAHIAATDPHGDRAYADGLFAANDAMLYKGVIDCSANPNYPAADAGHTYRVSVAGKLGGASGVNVEVGDIAICITDGSASGNQATVGANWDVLQVNLDGAVIGPASATVNRLAAFGATSGKTIKEPNATLSAGTQKIADVVDPGSPQDAATMNYVDTRVHAATGKTTPVDADELPLADSAASYGLRKLTWANVKATLKTYFDALYAPLTSPVRTVSGTTDTPTTADRTGVILYSNSGAITVSIPGSTFATGDTFTLIPTNATGVITTAASGGATASTPYGAKSSGQNKPLVILFTSATTYIVLGDPTT